MEFLDEGLSFCSFFEIVELENNQQIKQNEEDKNSNTIHLNSTKQNEKLMILYSKTQARVEC
ncbi:hypothetical protein [Helicobacter rodentium]|uniref:hypothetical protein n=1 Tax=Helicobacter rodentium TaxID=59617 RepID=UPI00047B5BE2|nr:hypothetical protein [Helicobacter rodentium]